MMLLSSSSSKSMIRGIESSAAPASLNDCRYCERLQLLRKVGREGISLNAMKVLLLFLRSGAGIGKVLEAERPCEAKGCDVPASNALLLDIMAGPGEGEGVGVGCCSSFESYSSDGKVGEDVSSRGASCRDSTAPRFWAEAMSSRLLV